MKKLLFTFLLLIIALPVFALPLNADITADSAIVINLDNNRIMYTKNPDKEQILASLTKMMTAYTVLNKVDNLNKKVTINANDLKDLYGFTCAGLKEGDKVTYLDLLYAMMLISGADAAQALGNHVAGSQAEFVKLMNEEAYKLGMTHSHFADTFGGDDDNVSTAREMTMLLSKALQNKTYKKIFETTNYTLSNGLAVVNYTRSYATFHGLDDTRIHGNKSGYTPEAGLLLASNTKINGINYGVIVMKCKVNSYYSTHVLDTFKVYEFLDKVKIKEQTLLKRGTLLKSIPVHDATINSYAVTLEKNIVADLTDEEAKKVQIEYHIVDSLTPEDKIGQNIGYIDFLIDGEIIDSYNVYLRDEIFTIEQESKIIIIFIIILTLIVILLLCTNLLTIQKSR